MAARFVATLGIKAASVEMPIGQLSGGNQQKATLARWFATEPRLLILDEPTRGIDITFDGPHSSWWTQIFIGALPFVFCLLQRVFEARRAPTP